jgi:hypothetical protein
MSESKISPEAKAAVEEGNRIRKQLTSQPKKVAAKKVADSEQKEESEGKDKGGTTEATPAVEDGVLHSEQTNLTETRKD